jgi:hypothetical protein
MKKNLNPRVIFIFSILTLVLFICNTTSFALKITDTEKLYAEIAGDYEFEVEGETSIITFFVKDGVLMGRDSESDPGTLLEQIEGKELEFKAISDEGQLFEITFSRDDSGKIAKCLLVTMGMEYEGQKVRE